MNSRSILALLGVLVLLGCATPSAQQPKSSPYLRALEDARFPLPSEVAEDLVVLKQGEAKLRWDGKGRVLVTTWTKQAYYEASEYKQGYSFALYGETWFTVADQVRTLCSESELRGAALRLRLEQLLGLPQGGSSDSFLQVWIDPAALFRPCAEPSVTETSCPIAAPLHSPSGKDVVWDCSAPANEHAQWLCNTWVDRYGSSDLNKRYPWTALGYTYDWSPNNMKHIGPSEFVAKGKSQVIFERLVSTVEFCTSPDFSNRTGF